MRRWISTQV